MTVLIDRAVPGIWNVPGPNMDGPFKLPQALWPYVTPQHSVYAQGPPTTGYWKEGMVVWRALDGIPAGNETSSVPQYQPIQKFTPAARGEQTAHRRPIV
jgi:hypothetical protein